MTEFEAAAKYGMIPDATLQIDPARNWFTLPRETRAMLAAEMRLKNLGDALTGSDMQDWAEAEAKRKQKAAEAARKNGKGR